MLHYIYNPLSPCVYLCIHCVHVCDKGIAHSIQLIDFDHDGHSQYLLIWNHYNIRDFADDFSIWIFS